MQITYAISLDMMRPETPPRIQVKQGDSYSRALALTLFCDGEPWPIPSDVVPMIRWSASNPDTGETASGIYDTLPNGNRAWLYAQNLLDLILTPQMFSLPGLVRADVALVQNDRVLATFDFEIYVNRSPANGTEPEAQSWYKIATLEQINEQFVHLKTLIQELREDMESAIADWEQSAT